MMILDISQLDSETKTKLTHYLLPFVTDNKKQKFEEVLRNRTRHFTLILEDIFHPHNANACIRSSECFGLQDIHIVEDRYEYDINPKVLRGSGKWINMHRYSAIEEAITTLKTEGYKIAATSPKKNSIALENLPIEHKLALAFGTELEGISDTLQRQADYLVHIPMYGFTESFNVSVAVAIVLHYLTEKLKENPSISWQLSEDEKSDVLLEWVLKSIARAEMHIKQFFKERIPHKPN